MKSEKSSQKSIIPIRVIVGILGCVGCCLIYVLRSNLSVAIIAMVDSKVNAEANTGIKDNRLCYDINSINRSDYDPGYKGTYVWSQSIQGVILGSYYYGYTATQFCGAFADKFGAKWMAGLGVVVPAVFNALIPVLADIHYSLLIVLRVLMGAFHGVVYSCLFSMFAKWFPQSEKNLAITGTIFGGNVGGVITMPLTGYLCGIDFLGGWPSVFYLTSIIHIIFFILWYYYVSDTPESHPNISESELEYIQNNNKHSKNVRNLAIPWKAIITSKPVWASMMTKMSGYFGYYLLCTKMPQYLDSIFGMALHTNSWFNSIMYASVCCSNVSAGPLSAWIQNKNWFSHTRNRKNFNSFAMFSCSLCLLLVPIVDCNRDAVIALLMIGMFSFGFITGGEMATIPEYAPNYSGTVYGFANTLASSTGFVAPLIVGLLLDHGAESGARHQWNIIWYLSAAIYAFGGIAFELFGTAEPQSWAMISHET